MSEAHAAKAAAVHRILARYLVEVVERHALCPWARAAREHGELAVEIVWGTPALAAWRAAAERALARPGAAVAMVVAPELAITRAALAAVRDQLAAALPAAGIAEFHPDAALDLATPARLVPFLRRAPDPLLQLVPLAILDRVRAAPPLAERAQQAAMLGGRAAPPRPATAHRIADANHATLRVAHAEITATLDAIAADRRAAYTRAGVLSASR
ncbi:MAG TPA: hypothetical protein VFP84_36860 [Kofleriaceae bacterium]|nr:hypothetical protein [Kofleriaceae bacterium]